MNGILCVAVALWIGTFMVQGLNMITIAALISTCLFCARKIGFFCKLSHLLVTEGIGFFLVLVWQSVFGGVQWSELIITLVIRLVFLGVYYYDSTVWVYVKEKHRKENE